MVRDFTVESGAKCENRPTPMNVDEMTFISKMIVDELLEMWATVHDSPTSKLVLNNLIQEAKSLERIDYPSNEDGVVSKIADQFDAFVDMNYYMLNTACKKGVNLGPIFLMVHTANMNKRDPLTNTFIKRKDGKIIKPVGWKEPDVRGQIQKQMDAGAWVEDSLE